MTKYFKLIRKICHCTFYSLLCTLYPYYQKRYIKKDISETTTHSYEITRKTFTIDIFSILSTKNVNIQIYVFFGFYTGMFLKMKKKNCVKEL